MTVSCTLGQELLVHSCEHFIVESCGSCFVPGYLIVRPKEVAGSLSCMSPAALTALGPTLAMVTRTIEAVVHPERVYCALFSEQTRTVHFHLFPRSTWLAAEYVATHPDGPEISGPRLMDWARRVFQQPIPGRNADEILRKIRDYWRRPNTSLEPTATALADSTTR